MSILDKFKNKWSPFYTYEYTAGVGDMIEAYMELRDRRPLSVTDEAELLELRKVMNFTLTMSWNKGHIK